MRRRRGNVFSSSRMGFVQWFMVAVGILLVGCGIYTVFDNGRIVMKTQKVLVASLPDSLEGFTILHISDLNGKRFGPRQKLLLDILKKKKYDAVCLTGDMVGTGGDMYPFHELLAALDMTKPVFFIAGDSDPAPVTHQGTDGRTVLADWVTGAAARGAVFLDAPTSVKVGNASIWFSDASQLFLDLDTAESAYASSGRAGAEYYTNLIQRTKNAREQMRDAAVHITLSHNPLKRESVSSLQNSSSTEVGAFFRTVDLILSGGMVGGQWRIPLIGPVFGNGFLPDDSTVLGYHYMGNTLQYISGGLGASGTTPLPPFRLFNTPEITLITLTSMMDESVLPDN